MSLATGLLLFAALAVGTATAQPSAARNPAHAGPAPAGAALPTADPDLPRLVIPVAGVRATQLIDSYQDGRPGHRHEAIDIMAPSGTPVLAAADGPLVKLFTSVPGGLTVYQFDRQGRYAFYYAHLDRYASGMAEGMPLQRGQLIGYVGTCGNAPGHVPHLHFEVHRLGPEKQWWQGAPMNPFTALRNADEGPLSAPSGAASP